MNELKDVAEWVPVIIAVASAISAVTPTPIDNIVVRILRILALNVLYAKPEKTNDRDHKTTDDVGR